MATLFFSRISLTSYPSLPAGVPLCSATLQWLLAENAAVDIVRAQALSSVQGVAPDGTDVHLIVREASRGTAHLPVGKLASPPAVLSRSLDQWYWAALEESDQG